MTISCLLAHWVHNIDPIAIHFPKGFFLEGIYWYGIAYMLSFLIALKLLENYHQKKHSPIIPADQSSFLTYLILGVLIGGRIGYFILYQPSVFIEDPLLICKIWEPGMASHGGFLGVIIAILYFSNRHDYPVLKIADIASTLAPPGFLIGRIANFINGELWGKVTNAPWGIIFPGSAPYPNYPYIHLLPPRHPSQLYEAFLEGFLLIVFTQYRLRAQKAKKIRYGQLASEFLFIYALLRFFVEYFREPDASLIMNCSRGQFYSLFLIFLSLCIKAYLYISSKKINKRHLYKKPKY